jgi:hypothetical protein
VKEISNKYCIRNTVAQKMYNTIFLCRLLYLNLRKVKVGKYCAGGKIKKNEMGWACGAYGGGERCAQGVGGEA